MATGTPPPPNPQTLAALQALLDAVDKLTTAAGTLQATAAALTAATAPKPPGPPGPPPNPFGVGSAVSQAVTSRLPSWAKPLGGRLGSAFGKSKVGRGLSSAMKRFGKTKMGRTLGKSAVARIGTGLVGKAAGAIVGRGVGAAAGATLGAAGGPVGMAIGVAVGAAVDGLQKFGKAVVEGAEKQQQANFKYAEQSAAMAGVKFRSEQADFFRDNEKGNRMSGTARYLSEGEQGFKDSTKNIEVLLGNLSNVVYGIGMRIISGILEPIDQIAEIADAFAKKYILGYTGPEKDLSFYQWIEETNKESERAKARGDEWFKARDYSSQRRREKG